MKNKEIVKESIKGLLKKGDTYTRQGMCLYLGISDSELRSLIRELRQDGYPICSNSRKNGYWLGSKEEIEQTINEYRHRAYDMLRTAIALEKKKSIGVQQEWEV